VRPYAEKMGLAYAAADLAVARAGASTVAELQAAGVPTVFMPYPFHRDQHQAQQARAVERLGAAAVIEDRPADPEGTWRRLAEVLGSLMKDKTRLDAMRERAHAVGRPQAAEAIAREILNLAAAVADRRHAALAAARSG
jgi:UDP-N-acetylglucosamine--N-acetylmuramyl-(pentapeptide) pyrophosphoryl-undecaprenol N-acetylglucosamine transferase